MKQGKAAMKTQDLLTITMVALGTATLTVATFLAHSLKAGGEGNPPATTIATPKLVADGIEMTLAPAGGREFKAGEQPAFELRAVNTLNKSCSVAVCVRMSSTGPESTLSRMPIMPRSLWQEERILTLGPNQTQAIQFSTRTNLPVNSMISISLSKAPSPGERKAPPPGALRPSQALWR
jgi:hypothetical protein